MSGKLRKKLARYFKNEISGSFSADPYTLLQYATGACMYRIFPLGVVFPRDGDDVAKAMRIARDFDIPITARGAGAALTGSALGTGLIIDFSRYMHRILSIDVENGSIKVEPGLVQAELNRAIKKYDLIFPPDPSSSAYCTIGGMVGNNAAGAHSLKYGATWQHVKKISAILADGTEVVFENHQPVPTDTTSRLNRLILDIAALLRANSATLAENLPQTSKNASGYLLDRFFQPDGTLNMTRLLTASEGTLALFTGMELNIEPMPLHQGLTLLFCETVEAAGEAVVMARELNPSMMELMEDTFVKLVRKSAFDIGIPIPGNFKSLLLVEFDGESSEEVADRLDVLEKRLIGPGKPVISARRGVTVAERERLLKVRNAASAILNRMPAPYYPARFIEDGTVPVQNLPDYISGLHSIFNKYDIQGVIFGHAGDGNLHVNPFVDVSRRDFPEIIQRIGRETANLLRSLNGSLSGEHGDGLVRSPFIPGLFGDAYPVMKQLKQLFDPENILNPGKIVNGETHGITDDLKIVDILHPMQTESPLDADFVKDELVKCSGCGTCRSYCPVFSATRDEAATPRAKANLLNWIITHGKVDVASGVGAREKTLLNLCINCGGCLYQCPSGVNIPRLVQTGKWAYHLGWGDSTIQDRIITASKTAGTLGTANAAIANKILGSGFLRKAAERMAGIDSRRGLPEFTHLPLHSREIHADLSARKRTIIYFPGCFADYNDPEGEGDAVLYILKLHGYAPFIPNTECCGIAKITAGLQDAAIKDAKQNVDILKPYIDRGYRIISSAPSCGLAIRTEYPLLLQTPAARSVSDNLLDIQEFLAGLLGEGKLDMQFQAIPLRVAVHQPCHQRAMGFGPLTAKLLRLIPGLDVTELEPRCCGIAGTYGIRKDNYALSMQIGKPLFIEIANVEPELIVTSCGTCRMQIEQATGVPTIHPATLIARAYGFSFQSAGLKLLYGSHPSG